jgi:membrane dipeptidase
MPAVAGSSESLETFMRHAALAASILVSLALAAPIAQAQDAATRLAQDAIIVDTHIDAPGILMDKWADLGVEAKDREFDHPKSRAGGLDVAFMSIYTSPKQDADGSAWQVANQMIDGVEALVQRHPGKFAILASPKDAARLIEGGRVLLPMGMENGAPLGDQLANVQFFFDRGVRYITLAHSANNRLADSSYALEKKWNGLSPFGREVVREMNRVGIMVDVSHLGDASAMEAIATEPSAGDRQPFRVPPFHPGFRAQHQRRHRQGGGGEGRRDPDPVRHRLHRPGQRRRYPGAFPRDQRLRPQQRRPEGARPAAEGPRRVRHGLGRRPSAARKHLGAGPRPDRLRGEAARYRPCRHRLGLRRRGRRTAGELKTVADFPHLVAGLQARGYKDADIRKILGGNLLRAWGAIEDGAGK